MTKLLVKNKDIIVPGEELATGMDYLPGFGTYRENDKIIANRLGLLSIDGRAIKVVPLSGKYVPRRGDVIIAQIRDITLNGWLLDTHSAYSAMLPLKDATSEYIAKGADLTKYFNFGDYIICKITQVTSQKLVDVTTKGPGLRKLQHGRIIKVISSKVPRVIGKQGSMIGMVKQATDCRIIVGQNGLVWVSGEPKAEILAVKTIRKIEGESHISGLTDIIKEFLEKETGNKIIQKVIEDNTQSD